MADVFVSMLVARAMEFRANDGFDENASLTVPSWMKTKWRRSCVISEIGKKEAKLLLGGGRLTGGFYDRGLFVAPTIFDQVKWDSTIAQEEIFGPVLSVIRVPDFEEALRVANSVKYGLSSSVYTNDAAKMFAFVDRIETGMTHVNSSTVWSEAQSTVRRHERHRHRPTRDGQRGHRLLHGTQIGLHRLQREETVDFHAKFRHMATTPSLFPDITREIFFDIETIRLSHEVEGGWSNIARFGLAVAVTWDTDNRYRRWFEPDVKELITELGRFQRIVFFQRRSIRFRSASRLSSGEQTSRQNRLTWLADLQRKLGFRIKLDDLARETLGHQKTGKRAWKSSSGGGRAARKMFARTGENDVKLLVDLMEFAREK